MAGVPSNIKPSSFKGGVYMGGVSGSGPGRALSDAEKAAKPGLNPAAQRVKRERKPNTSGVLGSGNPIDQWVGKGDDKRYVQIPEANTDRGRVSTPASTTESDSGPKDQGNSRGAPMEAKSDRSANVPAAPGSLNYYMRKTMSDGRGNAKNRAYTLWKRDKEARARGGR